MMWAWQIEAATAKESAKDNQALAPTNQYSWLLFDDVATPLLAKLQVAFILKHEFA